MEYREFVFWYYRFLNGEYDLNYGRDKDKKIHELSSMPIDVVEEIVEHLDIFDRLAVRNVSRDLRALIDKRITSVKRISCNISHNFISLCIDNNQYFHKESKNPKTSQSIYNDEDRTMHLTCIEEPGAMKNSLKLLGYYLKSPKQKLKSLSIGTDQYDEAQRFSEDWDIIDQCYKKLESFLLSLEHQISTESFDNWFISEHFFLVALKSFEPGVLENMKGEVYWRRNEVMDEIVKTEQWKRAKRFISEGTMPAIVDGAAHFEEFAMDWNDGELKDAVRLKQLLLESKTFKKGELSTFVPGVYDRNASNDRIVEALGPRIFRDAENPLKWSYPIPDTDEFLDFHQDDDGVFHIERTT
ncbi:unnamed protein product [Caenorhabditis brenneri]